MRLAHVALAVTTLASFSSESTEAFGFLTGSARLAATFDLTLQPADGELPFPDGYVLVGVPKSASPAYTKAIFFVEKASMQITRMILLDAQRNKLAYTFVDPHFNVPVDPKQFVFVPPPNTTIFRKGARKEREQEDSRSPLRPGRDGSACRLCST